MNPGQHHDHASLRAAASPTRAFSQPQTGVASGEGSAGVCAFVHLFRHAPPSAPHQCMMYLHRGEEICTSHESSAWTMFRRPELVRRGTSRCARSRTSPQVNSPLPAAFGTTTWPMSSSAAARRRNVQEASRSSNCSLFHEREQKHLEPIVHVVVRRRSARVATLGERRQRSFTVDKRAERRERAPPSRRSATSGAPSPASLESLHSCRAGSSEVIDGVRISTSLSVAVEEVLHLTASLFRLDRAPSHSCSGACRCRAWRRASFAAAGRSYAARFATVASFLTVPAPGLPASARPVSQDVQRVCAQCAPHGQKEPVVPYQCSPHTSRR